MTLRLLDAGDSAVTLEFGSRVAPDLVARVATEAINGVASQVQRGVFDAMGLSAFLEAT